MKYQLCQVSVELGANRLVHDISLDFRVGELCMVVGPNGAGKTTLLRTLAGDIAPATGAIHLGQKPLDQWTHRELALTRAVLPQQSSLDFPFTVLDVALMGRMPHDTDPQSDESIARKALELCDCAHLAGRAFPTLSGGEQQRVQTARVLAQVWNEGADAERYLLLDEPVSALDLSHQYRLLKLLRGLAREERVGVICTLHNLNLAAQFADRCLILDQGRLVADGKPAEVFTLETLSNVFDLDIWLQRHPQDGQIPLIVPRLE